MDKSKAIQILKDFEGKVKDTDIITDNSTGIDYTLPELREIVNVST